MEVSNFWSSCSRPGIAAELLLIAILTGATAVAIKAQSTDIPPPPTRVPITQADIPRGQSIVRGRAVFNDTGRPAASVRVQLISTRVLGNTGGPAMFFSSLTNDRGEFSFNGVGAGEYYVVADLRETPSYPFPMPTGDAAADSARLEQFRQRATRISVDGQSRVEVELRVENPHFGALSGYIFNANGEIVARTRVSCVSTEKNASQFFGSSVMTDERGAFRIEKVPPGEYLVSADPPPKFQPGAPMGSFAPSFIPTFYPSTTNPAGAMPVSVAPDGEIPNINITLIERSAHTVSGTVRMRASAAPVSDVIIRLSPVTASRPAANVGTGAVQATTGGAVQISPTMFPNIQRTDRDGRWSFGNVPDGPYTITIEAKRPVPSRNNSAAANRPTPEFAAQRQKITVDGADLTDIAIELSAGGRISGSVVVEGGKSLPANMAITAIVKDGAQPPATVTVQADGSFTFIGAPEGEVSLFPQLRPPNTFYVKAIEANGLDLTRQLLTVEEGTEIKNVRIVISDAVALFSGHVLSAQGKSPLSRVAIFLVPADPERRQISIARFSTMTNSDGSFLVGAAPGDYLVITWRPGDPLPPDADELVKSALHVTLLASERRSMDILK